MKRDLTTFLTTWLKSTERKPLVIRGARQVGKTWLIRDLASQHNFQLIELNFEKKPDLKSLFNSNDPQEIMTNISALTGKAINYDRVILFLDEIQAAPFLLEKLRWFAEDMPSLPVVAAGSLLDFTLAKHQFSMPVGRIGYAYVEPLSFEEFLEALNEKELRSYLQKFTWETKIPEAIHSKLLKFLKEYLIVGGMPSAVSAWAKTKMPSTINQIHFDLLATYRDDFAKYSGRLSIEHLEDLINAVPLQLGNKFVYKNVNPSAGSTSMKQALNLLSTARICHRIIATSANGLPLGAETNEKFFKVIMLDCGLSSAALGLSLDQIHSLNEINLINSGSIAEQLAGQLLRTITPPYTPPNLYYWQREKKGAEAEIDYIIQHESQVVPIEIKAGTTGTLRSLHQFMKEKKGKIAIRVNSDVPRIGPVSFTDSTNHLVNYTLLSIPFYLLGQLHRLTKDAGKKSN